MGSFVVKQPNGLYCRFSTVVDCPTDWDMTKEEYIEMCIEKSRKEAEETIELNLKPFDWVKKYFIPNNMSTNEFKEALKEMNKMK